MAITANIAAEQFTLRYLGEKQEHLMTACLLNFISVENRIC
jgi:hypothetical protein